MNWSQIVKPDRLISNSRTSMITGIINIDKQLVILLDFENIVAQISPEAGIQLSDIERLGRVQRITNRFCMQRILSF